MSRKKRFRKRQLLPVLLVIAIILALLWRPVYRNTFLKAAYPEKYQGIVEKYSKQSGLDPCLVYAVIKCESSFVPDAESSIGAKGLMQLTQPTFEWAMSKTTEKENYLSDDLYKPEINVHYGTIVLSRLVNEFGDESTAVAAYHAGRGNVNKWLSNSKYSKDGKTLYYIPFNDTRAYVKRVEAAKKIYADLYGSN